MTLTQTVATPALTAEQEAGQVLGELLHMLGSPDINLKLALRKAVHACNLLNWEADHRWFEAEIRGYRDDQELAWYRKGIPAVRRWRPDSTRDIMTNAVEEIRTPEDETVEYHDVRWGIDEVIKRAGVGVFFPTGKRESKWSRLNQADMAGQEVLSFSKDSITGVAAKLENDLFRWATSAYTSVRFGDAVSDIWQLARAEVDATLTSLGFDGHLRQIHAGLISEDEEAWRLSMLACRNLLSDFASHLWKDERPTYEFLDKDGEPIKVTNDRSINRIIAYLHQKGVSGTEGGYLRAEWRRLQELIALASEGKGQVTVEQARLTAISTYLALAEVVSRTDLQPISEYSRPGSEKTTEGQASA